MLVLQGERDPFGGPDEVRATFASGALRAVRVVPGLGHELKPTKLISAEVIEDAIIEPVLKFIDGPLDYVRTADVG